MKKITYTVSWSERPENWSIPGAIKLLEVVRKKAIALEQKKLEKSSREETHRLLERIRKM